MSMQYDFMMSSMPGMQNVPPFNNPSMPYNYMSTPPMGMNYPGLSNPTSEEIQLQQLRFQLLQLEFMKQSIEQSLEFVAKSTTEIEAFIKRLESAKPKKGA